MSTHSSISGMRVAFVAGHMAGSVADLLCTSQQLQPLFLQPLPLLLCVAAWRCMLGLQQAGTSQDLLPVQQRSANMQVFAKCGVIKEDDERRPRVKVYRDRDSGMPKGDGLVTYLKDPSVGSCCCLYMSSLFCSFAALMTALIWCHIQHAILAQDVSRLADCNSALHAM